MLLRKKKTFRQKFEAFYLARTRNERMFVTLVCLASIFYLIDSNYLILFRKSIEEVQTKISASQTAYADEEKKLASIEKEILRLQEEPLKKDLAKLTEEVKKADKELSALASSLTSPEKTMTLIHDVLKTYPSVSLVSLESTDPMRIERLSILLKKNLYLHKVSIVCEATYPVLVDFFKEFEERQPLVTGKSIILERSNYPLIQAQVSYEIYSYAQGFASV
jgi:hypothetical protein